MTDRHSGYIVALEENIREDDAEATIAALRHIRGVVDVAPVVADTQGAIAEMRSDSRWRNALVALIRGGVDDRG